MIKIKAHLSFRPTTEKAIKGITAALEELDAVVAHENREIEKQDAAIDRAAKARLDAFTRRDRAEQIAKRFNDLVA
ncbi:hypothetical protein GOB43_17770 [Sinorhizobium meliloti]|uniref:hypothetical protein n=1 Tax=Rhizobium meliloti TaxID=382 RepID=UPI000FD32220|nr:hypothetical protein [Sinorhizobium meliloti]MDX1046888.1 hypothetical protein [Sinorhizobium medicae]MDW9519112.1 hypothetical protein [Sinorhizobium meliloti]MDX0094263.1 hypothetical protein [Sinorhizobium meliloti]MDX0139279.1 hypothetical protein [Sinorhizobium meliloti]MDX0194042.1 hypothetical protein [Sinorhizobium meliloti]